MNRIADESTFENGAQQIQIEKWHNQNQYQLRTIPEKQFYIS